MSAHADEESDEGVVPMKPSKTGALPLRSKNLAQGERRRSGGGSDTAPDQRVERAQRRTPSGATERVGSARRVLFGGRGEILVPPATQDRRARPPIDHYGRDARPGRMRCSVMVRYHRLGLSRACSDEDQIAGSPNARVR